MQSVAYGDFSNEYLGNQKSLLSSTYSLGLYTNREMQKKALLREEQNRGGLHLSGLNPLSTSKSQQRRT